MLNTVILILLGIYLGIGLVIALITTSFQILGGKAKGFDLIFGSILSILFWPGALLLLLK